MSICIADIDYGAYLHVMQILNARCGSYMHVYKH